jgi:hypothetical protein
MTLSEFLQARFPDDRRGGPMWLVREAKTSHKTINKILAGQPVGKRDTAKRISDATGGAVTIAELMQLSPNGRAA